MRIYDGSPRQNYEEVLRSIGAFLDQRGMREVMVVETSDSFVVQGLAGRSPAGGVVTPEHDHRIAMAGVVLGLSASDETTRPAGDIATSFPTFAETLRALGAALD